MLKCNICPRECGVDRSSGKLGFCRVPEGFLVAKTMIHKWEEPCIAGEGGAGGIFGREGLCGIRHEKRLSRSDESRRPFAVA